MNATKLRADLYAVLDSVIDTGKPVLIERKGKRLRIALDSEAVTSRSRALPPIDRKLVRGDAERLVHVDWSEAWKP
jgi:hypothetical protein